MQVGCRACAEVKTELAKHTGTPWGEVVLVRLERRMGAPQTWLSIKGASKRSFYREPNEGANDAAQQPYWILCNVAQHLKC